MSEANKMQVGGTHYKTQYQHWDLVIAAGMGYFDGQATKYVTRWRHKNGQQDLVKALHFVNKLIENISKIDSPLWSAELDFERYIHENRLTTLEADCILTLASWQDEDDLDHARRCILALIAEAEPKPVPVTDSNKHAERT